MPQLKILGAQRVKALINMLNEQERQKLAELKKQQPTPEDAQRMADQQFGVTEIREELKKLEARIEELSSELSAKIGQTVSVKYNYRWGSDEYRRYSKVKDEIERGEYEKKAEEIRKEFKEKEQRLWLCETLEEAKAIVGIE